MKIIYSLLVVLSTSVAAQAQVTTPQFMAKTNADSCTTHRFKYNTYVPNITLGQIEHHYGDGKKDTAQLFFDFNQGNTGALFTRAYGAPGAYTAKAVLLYNGVRVDSVTQQFFSGKCRAFTGRIFADANTNCAYDHNDALVQRAVHLRVDSAGVAIDTVTAYGQWVYCRPWTVGAGVYTFTVLDMPAFYASSCQTGGSRTVNYAGYTGGPATVVDFGYTCVPGSTATDAMSGGSAMMRATTAGPSTVNGNYKNLGCQPISGTYSIKVSPKYSIGTSVTPAPSSVSGNTVTWNFSNLANGSTATVSVGVVPLATYTAGDTAVNVFSVMPNGTDIAPQNNIVIRHDTIRNSFDPNDKSVLPAGNVLAGTTLTYHINFENLGNDTAFNVYVLDTLSSTLDAGSFELVAASHPVRVFELAGVAGARILKFDFPGIRLAEKTNPQYNKGFVRFSIKAKTGLANNTNIPNRAGIYFDFNPVVMTNTAMNKIGTPQSVSVLQAASANSIHPNPATDALIISNADGTLHNAVLMNATGQVVRRWNISAGTNTVSIESLPTGFYFVQLHGTAGVQTEKLEKR